MVVLPDLKKARYMHSSVMLGQKIFVILGYHPPVDGERNDFLEVMDFAEQGKNWCIVNIEFNSFSMAKNPLICAMPSKNDILIWGNETFWYSSETKTISDFGVRKEMTRG